MWYEKCHIITYLSYTSMRLSCVGGFLRVSSGFWKRSALTNMKKDALKYMINRLWYGIFHITCLINPRPILAHGTSALGLKLASRVDMTCHVIWKMPYNFRLIHDLFHIALVISSRPYDHDHDGSYQICILSKHVYGF
jgi:hypothetical protein